MDIKYDASLCKSKLIGFIPSVDLDASAAFYTEMLGLELLGRDEYALEYAVNGTKLRVTGVGEVAAAGYTVLGWEVNDINATVDELDNRGVEFMQYEGMPQDAKGICTFPNGSKVAWFKDPDGNLLSITQVREA